MMDSDHVGRLRPCNKRDAIDRRLHCLSLSVHARMSEIAVERGDCLA
jgi:hypothetical protein